MSTPITIVGGIKSRPHIPRRTKFVNLHEDLLREVNKVFASQPLDQGGGGLNPPRPPKYFGLLLVHPCRPPLPPNKSYHRPFNYLEYVKDFTLMLMLEYLKLPLEQIMKQMMQK